LKYLLQKFRSTGNSSTGGYGVGRIELENYIEVYQHLKLNSSF